MLSSRTGYIRLIDLHMDIVTEVSNLQVEEALLKLSEEVNVEEEWQTHPSVLSTKTKK